MQQPPRFDPRTGQPIGPGYGPGGQPDGRGPAHSPVGSYGPGAPPPLHPQGQGGYGQAGYGPGGYPPNYPQTGFPQTMGYAPMGRPGQQSYTGLVTASWVLMGIVCAIAVVPVCGFASWFIAGPVFLASLILGILVVTRGGAVPGTVIIAMSVVVGPGFVAMAPLISTALGITAVGAQKNKNNQNNNWPTAPGPQYTPPGGVQPQAPTVKTRTWP